MAINKNAYARYGILDKCFANIYKEYFIEDLILACNQGLGEFSGKETNVSRRQIYDDIKFMKSDVGFGAPIESYPKGRRRYIRYEDKDFSIHNKKLTQAEEQQLKNSVMVLSRIKGLGDTSWLQELKLKLDIEIDDPSKDNTIISFQENVDLKNLDHLENLYNYIKNKQVLKIVYRSFKAVNQEEHILSPNFLKQYNNRWFLLGENHKFNSISIFALDRIESFTICSEPYRDSSVDYNDDYFEDIVGVTNISDNEVQNVKILLTDKVVPYITTKPFHRSQKQIKNNILDIRVKINPELISQILSYGNGMKVLEPESLIQIIKGKLKESLQSYD
ncbi:WYL domain-containing protein [Myroides odoratus]|uniref:helix-turn-helix transcriptional regulator n=1 Tax=Myroides odoratus TaxID=256 RepID=UPI00333E5FD6